VPAGDFSPDTLFVGIGYYGIWWSTDEDDSDKAYSYKMNISEKSFPDIKDKRFLLSVRCLQDLPDSPDSPDLPD